MFALYFSFDEYNLQNAAVIPFVCLLCIPRHRKLLPFLCSLRFCSLPLLWHIPQYCVVTVFISICCWI